MRGLKDPECHALFAGQTVMVFRWQSFTLRRSGSDAVPTKAEYGVRCTAVIGFFNVVGEF